MVPNVLRLGLECLAIALSRSHWGMSPLANFGRMPLGWSPSSGNDAGLVARGKRFRGSPTIELLECHRPGIAPMGSLTGHPHARAWCGHTWTSWVPLNSIRPGGNEEGLYRLRIPDCDPLLLIGSGKLADRVQGYRHYNHLECSWVTGSWYAHQRLELITDQIAAHLLSTMVLPLWQFEPFHNEPEGETQYRKAS